MVIASLIYLIVIMLWSRPVGLFFHWWNPTIVIGRLRPTMTNVLEGP